MTTFVRIQTIFCMVLTLKFIKLHLYEHSIPNWMASHIINITGKSLRLLFLNTKIADKSFLKALIFMVIAVMTGQVVFSQNIRTTEVSSSIISQSESANTNGQYYNQLVKKVMALLHSQPDSARALANRMLKEIDKDDVEKKIRIYNMLGASYHVQADYGNATDYFYKSLAIATNLKDKSLLADVYNNLGTVNMKIGNYKEALNYLNKAIDIYGDKSLERNKASALNNMGLVYMNINNFNKAKECFIRAYHGFDEQQDESGISATLGNIALMHVEEKGYDSALYFFNKAIEIATRIDNKYNLCITYQGMGNMYAGIRGKENESLNYYRKSKNIALQIKQLYQVAYSNLGIARVLSGEEQINEAFRLANEASAIAEEINNQLLASECHEVLSLVYEAAGDYRKSLLYYKEYVDLKEKVISQTIFHQIYNQEIANLNEKNQEKQFEIQRQAIELRHKNTIIILIGIAGIMIAIGLHLTYRNYRHRQNARLQEAMMKLNEKKSRAAIEAEINERNRIGQELHDSIGQMLSIARLNISVLREKASLTEERRQALLDSTLHSVDEAFYELRDISHNLAPAGLTRTGLAGAINNLAAQVNQSNQLKMEVEIFGIEIHHDSLIENSLYRAVQELLNNTIKHSGATAFSVQLIGNENEITLMAEDNGCGFDIQKVSLISGGLHNLRSRIENINGTLYIDSNPNHGTIVSIVIPKNTHNHAEKAHQRSYN